jgi:hypothetical protein
VNAKLANQSERLLKDKPAWYHISGGFIKLLLIIFLTSCNPPPTAVPTFPVSDAPIEIIPATPGNQADPAALPYEKPVKCPGLDSQLYQLTQSADPLSDAQARGLRVNNGKVQVLFDLASVDSAFLSDYDVEIGSQSGNQVQAFAPLDHLCVLANLSQVIAIRPPAAAIFP